MKGTILLIDDDLDFGDGIKEAVEMKTDYLFVIYRSGYKALADIDNGLNFDIAIVDLSLPDIDGIQVIRRIKSKYKNKPVLTLSAYNQVHPIVTTHLTKCSSIPVLIKTIDSLLQYRYLNGC